MKPLVLLLLVGLSGAQAAQAQANPLIHLAGAGTSLLFKSSKPHQQSETLYVTPTTYQAHSFPQKRTPARKLPKPEKGGTEITAMEQFLAGCYATFQADTTALLLSVAQEKEFGRLRSNLEAFNPAWNTDPYSEEVNFYRQHDDVRRRLARANAPR